MTATWNAALYLVTSCATSATSCVNGEDRQIPGPDRVDYSNTGSRARTYYLIVDSRAAAEAGEYSLNVTITP